MLFFRSYVCERVVLLFACMLGTYGLVEEMWLCWREWHTFVYICEVCVKCVSLAICHCH